MENKQRISEIEECIVAEMGRLQYSSRFIRSFRSEVHHLADFIRQKTGDEFFSEELGAEYLRTTINFPFETPHPLTAAEGSKIRCVRRIGEYQLYGAVSVSYTHLDVYKRQSHGRAVAAPLLDAALFPRP